MKYYGIVNNIQENFKPGIYGHKEDESVAKINAFIKNHGHESVLYEPFTGYRFSKDGIIFRLHDHSDENLKNAILISDKMLCIKYSVDFNTGLFQGLFNDFDDKNLAFKRLMKSNGGAQLLIFERNNLPKNLKHFGGEEGRFDLGLYCTHPKDENIIIPLKNSNELIKNLILEETLSAYEALGAKKIIIEDKTIVGAGLKSAGKGVKAELNSDYTKVILREKTFGRGIFDPERAVRDKLFVHDFPNIKTTISGRINGNQTSEKFTETVNLNAGLDVDVLNLYKVNTNFEYTRKWYFEVEFYDKNEL